MANTEPTWLEGVEGEAARELIESNARLIRVVAEPGSGKTTCLKRRTQRLIEGEEIDPRTMFVGTFTRAIASELQEALGHDIKVSTLHSLAFELLRNYPTARQGMRLRFLLKFEQDALLYDIEDAFPPLGDIHERRKELRRLQASRSQRAIYRNAKFAGAVRRWLQQHRAMLIGEVVFLCVVGLESEDIPSGPFDHVVIDEYQDLTAAEQELVRRVWSGKGSLTVMGDNDQSIYGFRFNHPEGIDSFHEAWLGGCKDLTFSENRRCGDHILNAANLMMAEAGSKKLRMVPMNGRNGQLTAIHWSTLDAEISGLASYMSSQVGESFLVLVPRRFIGYRLAEKIGHDAKTAFTEEVLDHPIAQEAFTAASLLANPDDWVASRAWLGFHGAYPKQASRRNTVAFQNLPRDIGGHDLIRRIANGNLHPIGPGKRNVKKRAQQAIELFERNLEPIEAVDLLFDEASADKESDPEKQRWLALDLRELRDAAHELLVDQNTPTLRAALNTMRYRIATRVPLRTADDKEPRVRIMTLHSAKGLEADNVVIAGVADQLMPGLSEDSNDVAEQKRLLYVAVTRARDSLTI